MLRIGSRGIKMKLLLTGTNDKPTRVLRHDCVINHFYNNYLDEVYITDVKFEFYNMSSLKETVATNVITEYLFQLLNKYTKGQAIVVGGPKHGGLINAPEPLHTFIALVSRPLDYKFDLDANNSGSEIAVCEKPYVEHKYLFKKWGFKSLDGTVYTSKVYQWEKCYDNALPLFLKELYEKELK